jgi:YidC/Oxa1 family membrane protein insertase
MDRKSIIVLVVCFLALMAWQPLVNKLYPPIPIKTNAVPAQASVVLTNGTVQTITGAPSPQVVTSGTPAAGAPGAVPSVFLSATNAPEQVVEITNALAHYTFSSHGGGLKKVELLRYAERTQGDARNLTNYASLTAFGAPTLSLLGVAEISGDYELSRTEQGVRARQQLTNGLTITKDFSIGSNYIVSGVLRVENGSGQALTFPQHEVVVGTATPMGPREDPNTIGVLWSDGGSSTDVGASWFANRTLGCMGSNPRSEYRGSNVVWAAAHNQFFTIAMMLPKPAQELVIRKVSLPRFTGPEAKYVSATSEAPAGYHTALVYPGVVLATNQSLEHAFNIYAGPKEYQTLVQVSSQYTNQIDKVMGYGPPFGFFAKGLLLGMNWLHDNLSLSYGWAIVVITIIIKLLFWPLTQASTRSMKRMQALQPQMNEIRQKYKDDPVKMNRKTMEFMRENKVSPLGGCLPMLLQIPVFFGFFTMIRSAIELRGADWFWVADLSKPDTLFMIPGLGFIPFLGVPGVGLPFNFLPLIMGVTMIWQARLTPPSPGMDPMQQKMMRYMPVIFIVFLYNFSAGLTLYWTVQNILTIIQTKLTKTKGPAKPAPAAVKPAVLTPRPKKRK